jgi:hypothetical protein
MVAIRGLGQKDPLGLEHSMDFIEESLGVCDMFDDAVAENDVELTIGIGDLVIWWLLNLCLVQIGIRQDGLVRVNAGDKTTSVAKIQLATRAATGAQVQDHGIRLQNVGYPLLK